MRDGLDLKTSLAVLRETKRKRQRRGMSGVHMADAVDQLNVSPNQIPEDHSPPDVEALEGITTGLEGESNNGACDGSRTHSTSIKVDPLLLRFLVGKGGCVKQKIETDTGVSLRIPSARDAKSSTPVVVEGTSEEAAEAAIQQIRQILDEAVKSPSLQYSHFISLPLALHTKLVESVTSFQESVLASVRPLCNEEDSALVELVPSDDEGEEKGLSSSVETRSETNIKQGRKEASSGDRGIDKSIFVKPATFHLTVLMLKLWNEDRVRAAIDCLQRAMPHVHEALERRSIAVNLRGVDCLRGNPTKAHVLYANVEEADQGARLVAACQVLIDAFVEAGLVLEKDQTQSLKLHATLMNTSHRKMRRGRSGRRVPFDASEIVATYGSWDWGNYQITEAHLSQRFVYDQNGYYQCCGSIIFP